MSGAGRQTIVSTGLYWPNGIFLDFTSGRVYWVDAYFDKVPLYQWLTADQLTRVLCRLSRAILMALTGSRFCLLLISIPMEWCYTITTCTSVTGSMILCIKQNLWAQVL